MQAEADEHPIHLYNKPTLSMFQIPRVQLRPTTIILFPLLTSFSMEFSLYNAPFYSTDRRRSLRLSN